jgi:DNA repair exonuclease SbcCD ATPase subunit
MRQIMAVTEQQVHEACDRLDARGIEPKYEEIRGELGATGSFSTIKKYLKTWTPRHAPPVPNPPPDLVRESSLALMSLWRAAMREASAAFEAERARLKDEIAQLEAAVEHQDADLETAEQRYLASEQAAADLQAVRQQLETRLIAAENAAAEVRGKLAAYEHMGNALPSRPPEDPGLGTNASPATSAKRVLKAGRTAASLSAVYARASDGNDEKRR